MALPMYAAIYIGSYEVNLKIFEFTSKKKVHDVEFIRSRLDLGKDAFSKGTIGYQMVDDLCEILGEFRQIISGYRIENYGVFASAVLRDISNELFVLDQIRIRTGFNVTVLSNSEHRFISYKAVVGQDIFEKMIQTSAAVVDIGGSSVQITIFSNGQLITTQNMDVGTMRLRSLLNRPGVSEERYKRELREYINKKFEVFRSIYLNEGIENIIFISDYGVEIIKGLEKGTNREKEVVKAEKLQKYMEKLEKKPLEEITAELNLSDEQDPLIIPSVLLCMSLVSYLNPANVWFPGVDINDGIAYDYADKNGIIRAGHDFEADIRSAAKQLSEHYHSFSPHIEALTVVSTQIFDTMKKVHGLDKRERLLLEVAVLLHDCGKFISLSDSPECAYQIIMSSEIIGLSHREREIVAQVVYYNTYPLDEYSELRERLDQADYLTVAKLAAILRVANALDQSHRQKFKNTRISLKDHQLVIAVEAFEDISLEQLLFDSKTAFFENVFSIKPVLKEKRVYRLDKQDKTEKTEKTAKAPKNAKTSRQDKQDKQDKQGE